MQENKQNNIERHDDEINLGELFVNLWGQKWVILSCVVIFLLFAVVYAKTRVDVYQVKAVVVPPERDDLSNINLNGLTEYTPESVFRLYFKELKSPNMLRDYYQFKEWFLKEGEELDKLSQSEIDSRFLGFLNGMNVSNSTPEFLQKTVDGKIVTGSGASLLQADITWNTLNSKKTSEFINGYLKYVNEKLAGKILKEQQASKEKQLAELTRIQELALDVERQQRELLILKMKEEKEIQISKINAEIDSTINAYFENLESEISQLKESLAIAQQLKIIEPKTLADFYSDSTLASQIEIYTNDKDQNKDFVSNNKGYLLGTQFLKAEIKELENRRKDTKFVEGLANLNKKLAIAKRNPELEILQKRTDDKPFVQAYIDTLDKVAQLENKNLDFKAPSFYQLSQEALAPGTVVGRNKNIYLAIGLVLGAMLGLFIALINIAVSNYKLKKQTT